MIKAVIFDMDGVLIDSEPLWRESATIIFQQAGAPLTHTLMRETTGLRIDEFIKHWQAYFRLAADERVLKKIILEDVCDRIRTKGKAMPYANEMVEWARNQGYRVALATSSPTPVIEAVMERLSLPASAFDVRLSAEHLSHGKPHPEIYLQAAHKLRVAPTECIAVEDSVNGMTAAKAARMEVLVIPEPGQRSDKRFGLADHLGQSLKDLSSILKAN